MDMDRRTVLKGTGAAAATSLFATTGAAAGISNIDDAFDLESDALQEALVVLEPGADYAVLDRFDLPLGTYEMEALDIVYTKATGATLQRIAGLQQVRYVEANRDLEWHNGDAQITTNAGTVQDRFDLGYTGDGVHVAVIDSGIDAYHPDLQNRLKHNYQYVDPLSVSGSAMWQDVGVADTDDIGHGTHCSGSIVGEGNQNPEYEGMAPDADLTVYAAGAGLSILAAVGAYDHLLQNHTRSEFEAGNIPEDEVVHLTSNSYGATGGADFNPVGASELATWEAFNAGITVVGSAGNSGPGENTLGAAKTAPYILCVAASHDGQGESGMDATVRPTDFSSRGRPDDNHDRALALQNVRDFHEALNEDSGGSRPTTHKARSQDVTVGPGTDAGGIAGGPGVGDSTYVSIEIKDDATEFLDIEVSWTPNQQDLDIFLYEGDTAAAQSGENDPIAASTSGSPGERIQKGGIEPSNSYTLEINPWANVASQATVTITEKGASSGDPVTGPYGLYRPSVIAPGSGVISTMGVSALKAAEATYGATPDETGAFYSALSGTSMSCPVTSGVVCQVMEAYYRNNAGEFPSPEQVFRLMEGGATPSPEKQSGYTPYNAGAGMVNALRSVRFAEQGFVPSYDQINLATEGELEFLSATGSRVDDGSLFTGGQTNKVDITIETLSHEVVEAREVMPDGWTVVGTGDNVTASDDGTRVTFDTAVVNQATAEDTSASFSYFVEAPSGADETGSATFGPVEVKSDETDDGDVFVGVSGTSSTEFVLGPSTNV
jgi:serine protease AprX